MKQQQQQKKKEKKKKDKKIYKYKVITGSAVADFFARITL